MEFEVNLSQKFESIKKLKVSSSDRTNKIFIGAEDQVKFALGESDNTIGNNQNNLKCNFIRIEGDSSDDNQEDLIIGDSMNFHQLNNSSQKLSNMNSKRENIEENLQADESLNEERSLISQSFNDLKSPLVDLNDKDSILNKYSTLKLPPNNSELIEIDEKININIKMKNNNKNSNSNKKPKKNNKYNSFLKKEKINNSSKDQDKLRSLKKEKIQELHERYSNDKNVHLMIETPLNRNTNDNNNNFGQVIFSSTLRQQKSNKPDNSKKNGNYGHSKVVSSIIHHQNFVNEDAKKKSKEDMLQICKNFKHEKHFNMFEFETLNSLIRLEENYSPKPNFLEINQKFIDSKVRTVLLGWMGEVCEDLWFCRETFYMACNYVDRYLEITQDVLRKDIQLIGLTCLYISSKMEEIQMRCVSDYLASACDIYSETQMKDCEIEIISKLEFKLNPPTLNLWVNLFMIQWDNFISSDPFIEDHVLTNQTKAIFQFKQGNEESYNLYRELMQYLGNIII